MYLWTNIDCVGTVSCNRRRLGQPRRSSYMVWKYSKLDWETSFKTYLWLSALRRRQSASDKLLGSRFMEHVRGKMNAALRMAFVLEYTLDDIVTAGLTNCL